MGIFFASLNVKYRDVRSALPFIIQIMMFVTPIIYPITLIPERFRIFAYLNPATGAVSSIKSSVFGQPVDWMGLAISWASAIVMLLIGVWYFKRTEKGFADII
jgi:lipopolysaccharide transport system permease protein